MKSHILVELVLVVAVLVGCSKAPVVEKTQATTHFSIAYTTELEAVTNALKQSEHNSEVVEYAGVIFELEGKYYFTLPQTTNSYDRFEGTIRYPGKSTMIGIYHTHPHFENDPSARFSSADVKTGDELHTKMYLGVMKTNQIRLYVPGKTKVENLSGLGKISYGEVVGTY